MSIDVFNYGPKGDKKNSDFFYDYLSRIYKWRKEVGLDDMLSNVRALVMQVETGDAEQYLNELYFMTPYRFAAGYQNPTHRIYVLKNTDKTPLYFVLEPLSKDYEDKNTRLNKLFPISSTKPNSRYIGEVLQTSKVKELRKALESHDIVFHDKCESENALYNCKNFLFTVPSVYTHNRIGYTENDLIDVTNLDLGEPFELPDNIKQSLAKTEQIFSEKGLPNLILGVDHMATRILSSDRESSILEFLTQSNYYFWGAYNIGDMNSSTNVNRHPSVNTDLHSPAKVFTANNTPYFVNAFTGSPMPTEDFVRNLGPRMHHIAQEVRDGNHQAGEKNVDFVVDVIQNHGIDFLAHVFGECTDQPNLKQIFSKRSNYSMLITEYVERCFGFDGFFTKDNVAALTAAAGEDETVKKDLEDSGRVFD